MYITTTTAMLTVLYADRMTAQPALSSRRDILERLVRLRVHGDDAAVATASLRISLSIRVFFRAGFSSLVL